MSLSKPDKIRKINGLICVILYSRNQKIALPCRFYLFKIYFEFKTTGARLSDTEIYNNLFPNKKNIHKWSFNICSMVSK